MSLHQRGQFRKMHLAGGALNSTEGAESPVATGGEQIRQREFATVRRGYDPAQVRGYLTLVATQVDALERSLADALARVAELEIELRTALDAEPPAAEDPYDQLSKRFASVLVSADSEAAHVVEQARVEAEHIKAEARARAEEARMRGSQSMIAAREEADRMLASLAERRAAMLGQLHEMQSRLLSVAEDLEVAIQPADPEVSTDAPADPEVSTDAPPDPEVSTDAPPDLPDQSLFDFDLDLDDEPDLER